MMIRILAQIRFVLPILAVLPCAGPASAAQLTYALIVYGVPVAEATMTFDLSRAEYRMSLNYRTTGLGSLMSGDHLEEEASGIFDHEGVIPRVYHSTIRLHGANRLMNIRYDAGNPTITAIDPPNAAEREEVAPALRAHTVDTLSATIAMLHQAALSGKCDLTLHTYDGRRLEAFTAHGSGDEVIPASVHTQYAGHAMRCDYIAQPLAGFRVGEGREEDARIRRGTLWLAPVVDGLPKLPIRGEIDTRFLGRATMYLKEVKP